MKKQLTHFMTRSGEHHVLKAKTHAALAENFLDLADQNEGTSDMCKTMAASHSALADEHTAMADECAKCAKAFSDTSKSMMSDERDELVPTQVSIIAPTAPPNAYRAVPRFGQPVPAAKATDPDFQKLFAVGDDE